jgi:formylmethanofuran dehydrogenase subunit C
MLTLTLKEPLPVPLEAEVVSPDVVAGLTLDAIRALPVFLGKRHHRLDDHFTIDGEPSEDIVVRGDLTRVKWLGRGMTRGSLTIHGDVGMHLGAYMKGGAIRVHGNAGDWLGAEMKDGLIHVHGNAGGQLGAAYRGSTTGMRNGTILVDGHAGMEIGMRMRRGTIAVKGKVKDFAGLQMKGGSLFLLGGAELRTGAWMVRGTIVSLAPLKLLPTFSLTCDYIPTFLRLYAKRLATYGFDIPIDANAGAYQRYTGDTAVPGKGELLVWRALQR